MKIKTLSLTFMLTMLSFTSYADVNRLHVINSSSQPITIEYHNANSGSKQILGVAFAGSTLKIPVTLSERGYFEISSKKTKVGHLAIWRAHGQRGVLKLTFVSRFSDIQWDTY